MLVAAGALVIVAMTMSVQIHGLVAQDHTVLQKSGVKVHRNLRSECGVAGVDKSGCEQRTKGGRPCVWDPLEDGSREPWCYQSAPLDTARYKLDSQNSLTLTRNSTAYGYLDVAQLRFSAEAYNDDGNTLRVKIEDAKSHRYQITRDLVPFPDRSKAKKDAASRLHARKEHSPFSFTVYDDEDVLFDTRVAAHEQNNMIFSEMYMEISAQLPSDAEIFGLGEHIGELQRNAPPESLPKRITMWNRDLATPKDTNIYGAHPFMLVRTPKQNKYFGVYLQNSHGMDIVLHRDAVVTYKLLGGIFDFWFFAGPTAEDVLKQYAAVVGKPHLPPVWALGFHHCRYGFKNLDEVKQVVIKYREANIPLDTIWIDIDYMSRYRDFTFDETNFPLADVRSFVDDLHRNNQKMVLIIDPAIAVDDPKYETYRRGIEQNVFVKNLDNKTNFVGKVWPGLTMFPDFTKEVTHRWWADEIKLFLNDSQIDGLWIDMNEVCQFCDGSCLENSDEHVFTNYAINNNGHEEPLHTKALPVNLKYANNRTEFELHNVYGLMESIATRNAMIQYRPTERPFILSRSTSPGSGRLVGHWTGDNWSTWEHLRLSVASILNSQLFAIPFVGADICGFIGDTNEELCARWMQLGSFYPFSRNHNSLGFMGQEPYRWDSVRAASVNALKVRYSLLPLWYALFWRSHVFGEPVLRPLFFEFPDSPIAASEESFLVGKQLLVAPALEAGQRAVEVQLSNSSRWYNFYTFEELATGGGGNAALLEAPIDRIPLLLRGGFVTALQSPKLTVAETLRSAYSIIAALDADGQAHGEIVLDDGHSLDALKSYSIVRWTVNATEMVLRSSIESHNNHKVEHVKLDSIHILGLNVAPRAHSVTVNGNAFHADQPYPFASAKTLSLSGLNVPIGDFLNINWK